VRSWACLYTNWGSCADDQVEGHARHDVDQSSRQARFVAERNGSASGSGREELKALKLLLFSNVPLFVTRTISWSSSENRLYSSPNGSQIAKYRSKLSRILHPKIKPLALQHAATAMTIAAHNPGPHEENSSTSQNKSTHNAANSNMRPRFLLMDRSNVSRGRLLYPQVLPLHTQASKVHESSHEDSQCILQLNEALLVGRRES
jgi:hypothetical protein